MWWHYSTMLKLKHCKWFESGRVAKVLQVTPFRKVAEILGICRFVDCASHLPCKRHCKYSTCKYHVFMPECCKTQALGPYRGEPRTRIIYNTYMIILQCICIDASLKIREAAHIRNEETTSTHPISSIPPRICFLRQRTPSWFPFVVASSRNPWNEF